MEYFGDDTPVELDRRFNLRKFYFGYIMNRGYMTLDVLKRLWGKIPDVFFINYADTFMYRGTCIKDIMPYIVHHLRESGKTVNTLVEEYKQELRLDLAKKRRERERERYLQKQNKVREQEETMLFEVLEKELKQKIDELNERENKRRYEQYYKQLEEGNIYKLYETRDHKFREDRYMILKVIKEYEKFYLGEVKGCKTCVNKSDLVGKHRFYKIQDMRG